MAQKKNNKEKRMEKIGQTQQILEKKFSFKPSKPYGRYVGTPPPYARGKIQYNTITLGAQTKT